eukprot:3746243-Prymnesium_polylepis.3
MAYAAACVIGDQLRAVVINAGLKVIQPSCVQRTNVLDLHNANDRINIAVDSAPGEKDGGLSSLGLPSSLRTNWLSAAAGSAGSTTNGAGVATPAFSPSSQVSLPAFSPSSQVSLPAFSPVSYTHLRAHETLMNR